MLWWILRALRCEYSLNESALKAVIIYQSGGAWATSKPTILFTVLLWKWFLLNWQSIMAGKKWEESSISDVLIMTQVSNPAWNFWEKPLGPEIRLKLCIWSTKGSPWNKPGSICIITPLNLPFLKIAFIKILMPDIKLKLIYRSQKCINCSKKWFFHWQNETDDIWII